MRNDLCLKNTWGTLLTKPHFAYEQHKSNVLLCPDAKLGTFKVLQSQASLHCSAHPLLLNQAFATNTRGVTFRCAEEFVYWPISGLAFPTTIIRAFATLAFFHPKAFFGTQGASLHFQLTTFIKRAFNPVVRPGNISANRLLLSHAFELGSR